MSWRRQKSIFMAFCEGNPPMTSGFPPPRATKMRRVSCHSVTLKYSNFRPRTPWRWCCWQCSLLYYGANGFSGTGKSPSFLRYGGIVSVRHSVCPSDELNCHPEQKMERNRPCIWPIAPKYWEVCKFIQWRYVNLSVCSFVTAACLPSPYNSQFLCHYYVCYSYPAHWIVCSSVITRTIQLQRRHMGVMACHITGSSTVCSTIC